MPANASGWFWHTLAHGTGRIGHLFSPRAQRGPWPWLPYACDNGAFSCWDSASNTFDESKWRDTEQAWRELLVWCQCAPVKPRWAIVPDTPGNGEQTLAKWAKYYSEVSDSGIPTAIAVQDGMTPEMVRSLISQPDVIAVGGTTEWKWSTVEMWCREFPRVHVLRCNMPGKLDYLESLGCESTDGTGWNRGNRAQTQGLEEWCRNPKRAIQSQEPLWPYVSRAQRKNQLTFA
jgi:hypothetical protein